jgi:hypothetical protein
LDFRFTEFSEVRKESCNESFYSTLVPCASQGEFGGLLDALHRDFRLDALHPIASGQVSDLKAAVIVQVFGHDPQEEIAVACLCDESWAIGLSDARQRSAAGHELGFSLPYYLAVAAGLYLTWIVSTAIGAALGPAMGNVNAYGFDMAFPAVFLVLLRGMWKGMRAARPWLVSLLVAASTFLLVPGAWYAARCFVESSHDRVDPPWCPATSTYFVRR